MINKKKFFNIFMKLMIFFFLKIFYLEKFRCVYLTYNHKLFLQNFTKGILFLKHNKLDKK